MVTTRERTRTAKASLWFLFLWSNGSFQRGAVSFTLPRVPCFRLSRAAVGHIMTSSSSKVSESTTTSTDDWWKNVEFEHGHVAKRVRKDFPIILNAKTPSGKPITYLDSAATSQKPRAVLDSLEHYYTKLNSNVHRGAHQLSREATSAYEDARTKIASLVNAHSRNEIVFTSGATEAINLVAQTYGRTMLKEGDEVLLTVMEHHSNLVPWLMLAKEKKLVLKYVPVDPDTGGLDLDEMKNFLSKKTKLVSFQHVSNVMGCLNPVQQMVDLVHEHAPDAKILLDACQSVPHSKVNVQELNVDWMVASGHKACGPTGIGFLWGKLDVLENMPPFMGGGEMIDTVTLDDVSFAKAPAKFEAGTPPIAQAIGMAAGLSYLEKEIGWDVVEAYEHEMASYLYKRLNEVEGITVLGPSKDRAALCAFVSDSVHPSDLSSFLDMEGIAIRAGHHCCQPLHQALGYSHSARASLYIYNTKEDIDRFIEELQNTLDFFNNMNDSDNQNGSKDDDFVPFI